MKKTSRPTPGNQLVESANRALVQIRDLGFVRRGQGKVRLMLEEIINTTDAPRQRQLASELAWKLNGVGNARARMFAGELLANGALGTFRPSTKTASGSVTKVKKPDLGKLPPTSVTLAPTQMPKLNAQEAAELRRSDRTVALGIKSAVREIEKIVRLIRKDSPDSARQLERFARDLDAQRQALNAMAVNVK